MRIEHVVVGIIIVICLITFMRHVSRTDAEKAKPSLPVRALNALGANVESTRLLPATGELVGRGAVAGASKVRDVVAERWGRGQARRAERREARGERIAEVGERVRGVAAQRGQAVVEAMERRWGQREGDRPLIDRQARDDSAEPTPGPGPANVTQGDVDASTAPDSPVAPRRRWRLLRRFRWWRDRGSSGTAPIGSAEPELTHDTTCRRCGTEHTVTIPEGENAGEVLCGCKTRLIIFRDLKGIAPPVTDPEAWVAFKTLVAAEDGYCTSIKCTGNGTYVQVTPEDVNKIPCPHCTNPQEDTVTVPTTANGRPRPEDRVIVGAGAGPLPPGSPAVPPPGPWAASAARVAEFNPESDADLINFMAEEISGMCGYSDAYETLHETCLSSLGLDPRSVAGLNAFGQRIVEVTGEMARAHAQFVAIYHEVMQMVADGTVMPHNGRFFSGDVTV
ncbi:hypothetical protein [Nonomuraea sp. NPDC050202]|uniref:hypothetical protein n=1 Tax=Nonomuraea sp. NPDC050202 TaxID=3155035 RepID=UPI0033CD1F03